MEKGEKKRQRGLCLYDQSQPDEPAADPVFLPLSVYSFPVVEYHSAPYAVW